MATKVFDFVQAMGNISLTIQNCNAPYRYTLRECGEEKRNPFIDVCTGVGKISFSSQTVSLDCVSIMYTYHNIVLTLTSQVTSEMLL